MSASRDQSQKIAFVYSNLYKVYQKGKTAAQEAVVPEAPAAVVRPASTHVLKTDDLNKAEAVKVSSYTPTEFIGKRVARPASIAAPVKAAAPKEAISSLKDNLKALNDLHARLRFMLQELEDLVKE